MTRLTLRGICRPDGSIELLDPIDGVPTDQVVSVAITFESEVAPPVVEATPSAFEERPGVRKMRDFLAECERKYGMQSADFHAQYRAGQLAPSGTFDLWATSCELFEDPNLRTDVQLLDHLDAVWETRGIVPISDPAWIEELIESPDFDPLHWDLLIEEV